VTDFTFCVSHKTESHKTLISYYCLTSAIVNFSSVHQHYAFNVISETGTSTIILLICISVLLILFWFMFI